MRFAIALLVLFSAAHHATAVCLFEGALIGALHKAAGTPDDSRLAGFAPIERITVLAADGTKLRGFMLPAATPGPRRTLLVAQGDAMLADQMLPLLQRFRNAGFDTLVFDFRGFGRSDGASSIAAIASDYEDIIQHIRRAYPGPRYYYAISGGGVVLMHALRVDPEHAGVVIDATPTRLPIFCRKSYYPIENVPASASHILLIQGRRDEAVPPQDSDRLAKKIRDRKGKSVVLDVDHPVPVPGADLNARVSATLAFFEGL